MLRDNERDKKRNDESNDNSNDHSDGRPINLNAEQQQRQPLEIYKVLTRLNIESQMLAEMIELIAQILKLNEIDSPEFTPIKYAAQSLKFTAKVLAEEYNEMGSLKTFAKEMFTVFTSASVEKKQKQLNEIFKLVEKKLAEVFSLQSSLLKLLSNNVNSYLINLEIINPLLREQISTAYAILKKTDTQLKLEFDRIYSQLRFLGKDSKDQETDKKTIDAILEKYKMILKQFTQNMFQISKFAFPSQKPEAAMASLEQARDLFLAVAHEDQALFMWLEVHKEYKNLLDLYRSEFTREFGNDQEIQRALAAFFTLKDSASLNQLLLKRKDFIVFMGAYLPSLDAAIASWKEGKQIFSTLVDVKFDLDGIRLELARGLGKVHGENYSFPKIREFHSDNISDIDKALENAINQMQKRLVKYPRSFEWIYFKVLDQYLKLTNQWMSVIQPTAFDAVYKKHQQVLKKIEKKYFAGLRAQVKQAAEANSMKQLSG